MGGEGKGNKILRRTISEIIIVNKILTSFSFKIFIERNIIRGEGKDFFFFKKKIYYRVKK